MYNKPGHTLLDPIPNIIQYSTTYLFMYTDENIFNVKLGSTTTINNFLTLILDVSCVVTNTSYSSVLLNYPNFCTSKKFSTSHFLLIRVCSKALILLNAKVLITIINGRFHLGQYTLYFQSASCFRLVSVAQLYHNMSNFYTNIYKFNKIR